MYLTKQSKKENRHIRQILRFYINKDSSVLDLGCGTQLVKKLIEGVGANYQGVDLENWGKRGVTICDAYKYIRDTKDSYDVITSTFAIDYMNPLVILEAIKKSAYFIFTTYNKPYEEGSVSLYTNRKWYYLKEHLFRKVIRNIILSIVRKRMITKMTITGNDYYYLYVIKGRKYGRR